MTITLDEVQHLAAQLSPLEQVRLIAYLTQRLAPALSAAPVSEPVAAQAPDSWTKLESFWQAIEDLGPAAPSATDQLLADRRRRQEVLEGRDRVHA